MAKKDPVTAAIRFLKELGVSYASHSYRYKEKGGTSRSSKELGIAEERIVKTLVFETETKEPLIVLMQGHLQVSTKMLSKVVGCKSITACDPKTAQKHSGYLIGGTSPFGFRRAATPVYYEESILDFDTILINGGKRGFLIEMSPKVISSTLKASPVTIGITK